MILLRILDFYVSDLPTLINVNKSHKLKSYFLSLAYSIPYACRIRCLRSILRIDLLNFNC